MLRRMLKQKTSKFVFGLREHSRAYVFLRRRDRRGAAIIMEGETADADAYLAQVGTIAI